MLVQGLGFGVSRPGALVEGLKCWVLETGAVGARFLAAGFGEFVLRGLGVQESGHGEPR